MTSQLTTITKVFQTKRKALAKYLPTEEIADKYIGGALWLIQKDRKLQACTPESLYECLHECAQLQLPVGAYGLVHLVPYGNTAKVLPDYKGLIQLALRHEKITTVQAEVVYAGDEFDLQLGTDPKIEHSPAIGNRGDIIGAYAWARMTNGELTIQWSDIDRIQKVKAAADKKAKNNCAIPWRDWFESMAIKVPVRQLYKRLPQTMEMLKAVEIEDEQEDAVTIDVERVETPKDVDERKAVLSALDDDTEIEEREVEAEDIDENGQVIPAELDDDDNAFSDLFD